MTDDQFERLIEALSSPLDVIVAVLIALLSAGIGFGLAVLNDSIARRRADRDALRSARLEVAHENSAWAFRLAGSDPKRIRAIALQYQMDSAPWLVKLRTLDDNDLVGSWYLRRIEILISIPTEERGWSRPESDMRTKIAMEISERLSAWAKADAASSEFDIWKDVTYATYTGHNYTLDDLARMEREHQRSMREPGAG